VGATAKAEEIAAATQQENTELKNMILNLTSTVEGLKQSAPTANPPSDPFSSSAAPPAGGFDAQMTAAIERALSPITKRLEADDAQEALRQKQAAVFQEVAAKMPALRDQTSEDYQLFEKLYNARADLQLIADAPRIVAEMTRGILSDQRAENRVFDEAKARASSVPGLGPSRAPAPTDAAQVNEAFDGLMKKGITEGFTDDDLGAYLNLKASKVSLEGK
jgi:hypothetical protein